MVLLHPASPTLQCRGTDPGEKGLRLPKRGMRWEGGYPGYTWSSGGVLGRRRAGVSAGSTGYRKQDTQKARRQIEMVKLWLLNTVQGKKHI